MLLTYRLVDPELEVFCNVAADLQHFAGRLRDFGRGCLNLSEKFLSLKTIPWWPGNIFEKGGFFENLNIKGVIQVRKSRQYSKISNWIQTVICPQTTTAVFDDVTTASARHF